MRVVHSYDQQASILWQARAQGKEEILISPD